MKKLGWTLVCLGVLGLFAAPAARAADVKGLAPHLRMPKTALVHPLNYDLSSSEIRRPDQFEDDPRSQIAVWQPFVEPGPVTRTTSNMLTNDTRIFRNVGPTKDKYPYVVRVEKGADAGKFFLYRNVRYHWFFEHVEKGDEPPDSNVPGVSGGGPWSPFLNMRDANTQFVLDMAEDKATKDDVWDKKLYANRHMTAYDSGISGSLNYKDSTVLQQVGMIMTYEYAQIPAPTVDGTGYPPPGQTQATADPVGPIPGTVNLTSVPDDSAFKKQVQLNDPPEGYSSFWNLKGTVDGVEYTKFTGYTLAYVEDHSLPAIDQSLLNPQGNVYETVVGGFLGEKHSVNYKDDNPNAEISSQQLQSEFSYYIGMEDIYHIPNPFYDGVTNRNPVIVFYFLKANDEYGPYVGGMSYGKERSWYAHRHPYWKDQSEEKRDKFVADRYANAWDSAWMKPYEKGAVYYICCDDLGNGGIQTLNEHWKTKKSLTNDPAYQQLMGELEAKDNQDAKDAKAALQALDEFIVSGGGSRALNRFAFIGFQEDRGRCVVGPITLEKTNTAVHNESNEVITDPKTGLQKEVKSGNWDIGAKRVIMPKHFATNSIEWNEQGASNYVPSDVEGKTPLQAKRYYQAWAQHPPDCLMEVAVSNCCGNSSPQGSLIKVEDSAEFSKPMIDMEITDMNSGNTHDVCVPCGEKLESGAKLKVTDKKTGAVVKEYEGFGCDSDFDLATHNWEVVENGKATKVCDIPEDANGPDKFKVITEDQRLQLTINPYDNIDRTTPFKGIVCTEMEIEALDQNQQPTGQMEQLEYQEEGQVKMAAKIVKDGSSLDRYALNEFDPTISFYHIFRAAGWYQIRVKAFDRGKTGGKGQSRELKLNVNVLPASFKVREINSQ